MRVVLCFLIFEYACGQFICGNCPEVTIAICGCNLYCVLVSILLSSLVKNKFQTDNPILFGENDNMQQFRMTSHPCCLLHGRTRNIDSCELDERQTSGETVIPGTNATVQDVADTFDRITDKLDKFKLNMNNPTWMLYQNVWILDSAHKGRFQVHLESSLS